MPRGLCLCFINQGEVHMIIKALLPLIAALKFKYDGLQGQHFGKEIAQVYKACKEELKLHQKEAKAALKAD